MSVWLCVCDICVCLRCLVCVCGLTVGGVVCLCAVLCVCLVCVVFVWRMRDVVCRSPWRSLLCKKRKRPSNSLQGALTAEGRPLPTTSKEEGNNKGQDKMTPKYQQNEECLAGGSELLQASLGIWGRAILALSPPSSKSSAFPPAPRLPPDSTDSHCSRHCAFTGVIPSVRTAAPRSLVHDLGAKLLLCECFGLIATLQEQSWAACPLSRVQVTAPGGAEAERPGPSGLPEQNYQHLLLTAHLIWKMGSLPLLGAPEV